MVLAATVVLAGCPGGTGIGGPWAGGVPVVPAVVPRLLPAPVPVRPRIRGGTGTGQRARVPGTRRRPGRLPVPGRPPVAPHLPSGTPTAPTVLDRLREPRASPSPCPDRSQPAGAGVEQPAAERASRWARASGAPARAAARVLSWVVVTGLGAVLDREGGAAGARAREALFDTEELLHLCARCFRYVPYAAFEDVSDVGRVHDALFCVAAPAEVWALREGRHATGGGGGR